MHTTIRVMEHGLEYITFYGQKHMAPFGACSGSTMVRAKPLGEPELRDLLIE